MDGYYKLIFGYKQTGLNEDQLVEELFAKGIDDALAGIGQLGIISLEFVCEGKDGYQEVVNAFERVKTVMPKLEFLEAIPDLVSTTDIAELTGLSRQAIRKQARQRKDFPYPAHFGSSQLWKLSDICEFYCHKTDHKIDSLIYGIAKATSELNARPRHYVLFPKKEARGFLSADNVDWMDIGETVLETFATESLYGGTLDQPVRFRRAPEIGSRPSRKSYN